MLFKKKGELPLLLLVGPDADPRVSDDGTVLAVEIVLFGDESVTPEMAEMSVLETGEFTGNAEFQPDDDAGLETGAPNGSSFEGENSKGLDVFVRSPFVARTSE